MAQTLTTYTTTVQNEVDDTSLAAKTVIQTCLKDTYQEILRQAGKYLVSTLTEDEVVTVGQNEYPTTHDAIVMKQVAYKPVDATNFNILTEISQDEALDLFINRPNSVPTNYYYNGDTLTIAPTPNDAGTLRKVYQPLIDELTDVSIIPDRYTTVVIKGATARFKQWEDNSAGTFMYDQWKNSALRDMILELSSQGRAPKPRLYGR